MVICIGREFGSGGHEIGLRLAERLGFELYDQAFIDEAAAKSGIDKEELKKADERTKSWWIFSARYDTPDTRFRGLPTNEILFKMQSEKILELAQKGSCIFVGRCADDVLERADIPRMSVFVSAPFAKRVERKMKITGEPEKTINARILRMDKERKTYYNFYTGREWGKPENYDFCINSSILGIEKSAELLAEIYESFFQKK